MKAHGTRQTRRVGLRVYRALRAVSFNSAMNLTDQPQSPFWLLRLPEGYCHVQRKVVPPLILQRIHFSKAANSSDGKHT